jgi:hypothetical protein
VGVGAEIYFGDAAKMRSDHHAGRGSGQKGEAPLVATTRGSIRFGPKQKGGVNATVFSSRF